MFHKPLKKELADLVKKPKQRHRVLPKPPHPVNTSLNNEHKPPSNASTPSGSGSATPIAASNSLPLPTQIKPSQSTDDLDNEPTPSGKFADYQIVSTTSKGWKYNVMKFSGSKDKDVEPTKWRQPIKLNRKDPPSSDKLNGGGGNGGGGGGSSADLKDGGLGNEEEDVKKLTPMVGPDGKNVIGADGRTVMVGPDGKVAGSGKGPVASKFGNKAATPNGKTKSKNAQRKKIKQTIIIPEEQRKLRREERYPWVIEEAPLEVKPTVASGDSDAVTAPTTVPGQVWVGRIEDPDKNQTHALLIPSGTTFQFVNSHRFYRFTRQRSGVVAPDEVESEFAKLQKSKNDPGLLWKRRKRDISEATRNTLASASASASQSLSLKNEDGEDVEFDDMGGQLRASTRGDDIFGDDDEEEKILKKRRDKELGQDGDLDEMEYEEEFADDDEKIDMDGDDEELREMEERLKREYRTANKMRDATIDDDEEEDAMDEVIALTGAGRDLKKLVKKTEKNDAYDSDDEEDRNPYASEEEEEEEPPPPVLDGPAVMNQQQQPTPANGAAPATPASPAVGVPPQPQSRPMPMPTVSATAPLKQLPHVTSQLSRPSSRPGSPLAGNLTPGMGNAIVAKRATSPKGGKTRPLGVGGAAAGARSPSPSPLGGGGGGIKPSSGLTPTGGRSPVASRAGSPTPISTSGATLKRKAVDEGPSSPVSPTSDGAGATAAAEAKPRKKPKRPLEESMIIAFLREKNEATTKDCIQKFQPYLRTEEARKAFTKMVKNVAAAKNNILILKEEYR